MDKVTVTRAAQGLLERSLIKREPNSSDGRSHRLVLTASGERLYGQIAPLALEYETQLLAGIDQLEIKKLERQLRRLEQAAGELSRR
jgi:DNA-binding MarR family transcriptional regulator